MSITPSEQPKWGYSFNVTYKHKFFLYIFLFVSILYGMYYFEQLISKIQFPSESNKNPSSH